MMRTNLAWIAAIALVLAACSGKHADTPTSVPGADQIKGTDGSTELPGVVLTLTPPTLRTCEHPDGRMVVKIGWNARASGATSVVVWVRDANSEEKRFFYGGPEGSADTGPWAVDGFTVRLEDGDKKGRTLATRTLHAVACLAESSSAASDHAH